MGCHTSGWRAIGVVATAMLCLPACYLAFTAPDTHRPTFLSVLSLHPNDVTRELERSAAAIRNGRPAEAAVILDPLSRQFDDDARIWNDLCVAHTMLRDYAAAIEECNRALWIAPEFLLAKNNLRWAEEERSRTAKPVGK